MHEGIDTLSQPAAVTTNRLTGWLCAFGVVLIWSGWVVVSRLGVGQTLTVHDMMALRFVVASVAVAPFVWRYWPRQLRWWQVVVMSFGQGVPYLLLAFTGLQYAPAAHAGTFINGTLPIFAAVLAWLWLAQRPSLWSVTGMLVILVGCVLIGRDEGSAGVNEDAWIGHLAFLGAAWFVSIHMISTRAWQLTAVQAMVCIPTINLLWFGPVYLAVLPKAIGSAPASEIVLQGLYQGLGPSVVAVLLFTTAIRSIGTTATAALMALVPGMATLIAIPVLGEWPSPLAWAGLAVVSAGIVLAAGWRPGQGRPSTQLTDSTGAPLR